MTGHRILSPEAMQWFSKKFRVVSGCDEFIVIDRDTKRVSARRVRYTGVLYFARDSFVSHQLEKVQ